MVFPKKKGRPKGSTKDDNICDQMTQEEKLEYQRTATQKSRAKQRGQQPSPDVATSSTSVTSPSPRNKVSSARAESNEKFHSPLTPRKSANVNCRSCAERKLKSLRIVNHCKLRFGEIAELVQTIQI